MEDTRAVFVSNISPSATEKTVSDFFSFCGRITRLNLRSGAEGSQEAVVVFETDSAAKTALLLTNALIVDRPITVVAHAPLEGELEASIPAEGSTYTERQHSVPDSERTKTSVVASMIASGYVLGADTIGKARDLDEKHMISLQLKVGAEQIKAKANEIDKQLHISETATAIKTGVVEKAKEVDTKFGISVTVGAATEVAKAQATALVAKANENETVAKGLGILKAVGTNISNSFYSFKDETSQAIDAKMGTNPQAGVGAVGGAPVPSAPTDSESEPLVSLEKN